LDAKIFERGGNEVSVTALGEAIVRQAQVVIEHTYRFGLTQQQQ
jgi:LysR family hydrogen peroxide-inducible transcriptional activator